MDIVDKMKSQIGDDPQHIFDHEVLFKLAVAEIERLRDNLQWISDRANTQLLSEQLNLPRPEHVEMAYDMNACARAALAKTNALTKED